MNFNSIFSAGKAPETPEQVQELLKNIIIMTNYLPGVRSSLGWRGIFRIPCDNECWTFKISGFEGIFGLNYSDSVNIEGCFISTFDIFYFPMPDEDMIENFSINGSLFAYRENYRQLIREFPEYPEFFNYFYTGKLKVNFDPVSLYITMAIESMSEDIIISENGVRVEGGTEDFLIEPGEPEQAIPSYSLSSSVFDLLVSSLSFHLGNGPSVLRLSLLPGEKRYFNEGNLRSGETCTDVTMNTLCAFFAEPGVTDKFSADGKTGMEIQEIIWYEGMTEIPESFSGFRFLNSGGIINSNSLNRTLLGIEFKPPLYVVSGFLGAGKTSFIKHFLEFQSQKYLFGAVIQNELGEAGLDGKLISEECRVVEMDEGCVCCSLSGNLRKGINSVITEFVPDFIILETTGAANPMNLISEINELRDIVRFDSVTTIADAANVADSLNNYEIAKDQLIAADIIILNKTDLLTDEEIEDTKKLVSGINRRAIITLAEFGRINPSFLYDPDVNTFSNNQAMHIAFHNHSTHSGDGLSGITLNLPDPVNSDDFIEKVQNLPFDIFRIKGLIKFDDCGELSLFQYVTGRFDISAYNGNVDTSFIVLIGKNIDRTGLSEYFRY